MKTARKVSFSIIWPEYRECSAAQIATWYSDAVANGEVSKTAAAEIAAARRCALISAKAYALQDIGTITLRRG